jgi:3D (Asp-Asp-Asp) domain-containing protein
MLILTVYSLPLKNDDEPEVKTELIKYKTEYVYKENVPSNVSKVLTEGVNGLVSIEKDTNNYTVIKNAVNEIVEVGTAPVGEYVGTLTGYGPDCKGCSPVGHVACRTEAGKNYSLTKDGITYTDDEYGEVRILAADFRLFPCGTVIEITNDTIEPTIGIVMDTGSTMRLYWRKYKMVWLDLAFPTEKGTSTVTNKKTEYSVKRWGW